MQARARLLGLVILYILRYLSSGMLIKDAAMAFRLGTQTARWASHLTHKVLWEVLTPIYMKVHQLCPVALYNFDIFISVLITHRSSVLQPLTEAKWKETASDF